MKVLLFLFIGLVCALPVYAQQFPGDEPMQVIDGEQAVRNANGDFSVPAAQRDQTPNSSVTRAFLKGAGYTAPTSDMTCSTNAQGVETCVPSNDVRAYVVAIIKFVLTVIGFLFFALLFYAGYLWTTAGGNDESVKKAQGIASKAVIGLSIILAAWAITTFITSFLQKSVTP